MIRKQGFTLIELLIVITIIGVLVGVVLVVINPTKVRQKARDSRRVTDLVTVSNAIKYALADTKIELVDTATCVTCKSTTGSRSVDGTGWVKFTTNSGDISDFLPNLPLDPLNDSTYYYEYASDGNKFEIDATFEDESYKNSVGEDGGSNASKQEVGTNLSLIP